jgi:hypothetical protein
MKGGGERGGEKGAACKLKEQDSRSKLYATGLQYFIFSPLHLQNARRSQPAGGMVGGKLIVFHD